MGGPFLIAHIIDSSAPQESLHKQIHVGAVN
jgi:hypothetical protein